MKKIIILVLMLIFGNDLIHAQKIVNEKVDVKGSKVEMKLSFADNIKIEAWKNNFIELQVTVDIKNNTFNDYYSLEVKNKNGKTSIEEVVDFDGIKKKIGERDQYNFNTDINYTLKVPGNLEFSLNTISGEIELMGCVGEMEIKTVSGFIDYSVPESHKANIDLSTVTGDVYSNLVFDNKPPKEISWVGTNRELSLNGGNTGVELKTVSGDIFLRKY
ncbi:DUF4097 family beta strand repeat-containing protein [Maribellus maritimus]|uniref:DUF4097 family beta strand repeat-containing protein n=1 Tax=Maribellus maritimus TaxID=2870838 RepID=UPI001EEC5778|nr:DUF4097 family beta strand repeat-containing protein [Maribellus maritimus]MCG6188771.1 DUF4097 domain-containing protein [Maribellus maritimus]